MSPTKTNTMNPLKAITQKNRHKSPLRRPGAALAPIRQKAAAASLQSSAWPCRPAGGDEPAGNHGSEAQSGKTAEKLAALTEEAFAEVPDLKPCPFCRQSDLLEVTGWTHMRPDGSEYEGAAVNCHRCDCLVPLAVWQNAGTALAAGSEVRP